MADFDMLGPAGSPTTIQLDRAAQQAQILQRVMQARETQANAEKTQMEVASEQQMQQALQEMAGIRRQAQPPVPMPGTPPGAGAVPKQPSSYELADQLDTYAQGFADRGLLKPASEVGGQAALIRSRQAAAEASQAQALQRQLEMPRKMAEATAAVLQTAVDQPTWELANARLAGMGLMNPYANRPYSPEIRDAIIAQSLTAKDRLDARFKQADDERAARHEQSWEKFTNARLGLMRESEAATARYREQSLKQSGGNTPVVGAPTEDTVKAAVALLQRDPKYKELPDEERVFAARTVAADAMARMKKNKGLDMQTALEQAMQANKAAITTTADTFLGFTRSKPTFKGAGGSAATALPMQGKDLSRYQKGKIYDTAAGPAMFNGTAFDVIDEGGE